MHYPLERAWCVHKAERHDQVLKGPIPAAKRSFMHVLMRYWHMEVPITQIQTGEVSSTLKPSQ